MPEIPGETLTQAAGSGSAYILNSRSPDALALLAQGQRNIAADRARQKEAKEKQAKDIGEKFTADIKYKSKTGRLFQGSFDEATTDLPQRLADAYLKAAQNPGPLTGINLKRETAQMLNEAEALRLHGEEKQTFWDKRAAAISTDPTRNFANYTTALGRTLIGEGGKRVRATDHKEEEVTALLDNDATTYNEPAVVAHVLKTVVPILQQREAHAGAIGGQHSADQVRGQLIEMQGGRPVLNADGTPRLNLNGPALELLDQGAVKVLADAHQSRLRGAPQGPTPRCPT